MKIRLAIWFLLLNSIVAFGLGNNGVPPWFGAASFNLTLDPNTNTNTTLSNGNLTATRTASGVAYAKIPLASFKNRGKWYIELTVNTAGATSDEWGIITTNGTITNVTSASAPSLANNSEISKGGITVAESVAQGTALTAFTSGQIVGVAIDFTNWQIWYRLAPSGNWNASGAANPATNVGGIDIRGYSNTLLGPFLSFATASGGIGTWNFGATAFNGTAPSGFTAGWSSVGGVATDGGWTSLDPSTKTSNLQLDDGNMIVHHTDSIAPAGAKAVSTSFVSSGKFYIEYLIRAIGNGADKVGLILSTGSFTDMNGGSNSCYVISTGLIRCNNANSAFSLASYVNGDIIGIATDFGNGKSWFRLNAGNWDGNAGHDPATNAGGIVMAAGAFAPATVYNTSQSGIFILNAGNAPFSQSVPSGFTAGWTK